MSQSKAHLHVYFSGMNYVREAGNELKMPPLYFLLLSSLYLKRAFVYWEFSLAPQLSAFYVWCFFVKVSAGLVYLSCKYFTIPLQRYVFERTRHAV